MNYIKCSKGRHGKWRLDPTFLKSYIRIWLPLLNLLYRQTDMQAGTLCKKKSQWTVIESHRVFIYMTLNYGKNLIFSLAPALFSLSPRRKKLNGLPTVRTCQATIEGLFVFSCVSIWFLRVKLRQIHLFFFQVHLNQFYCHRVALVIIIVGLAIILTFIYFKLSITATTTTSSYFWGAKRKVDGYRAIILSRKLHLRRV